MAKWEKEKKASSTKTKKTVAAKHVTAPNPLPQSSPVEGAGAEGNPAPAAAKKPFLKKGDASLIVLVALLAAAGLFLFFSQPSGAEASFSVSSITVTPQPAGVGFADITVTTTEPVDEVTVFVGERQASLVSSEGSVFYFRVFVSPYDDTGIKQIVATARKGSAVVKDDSKGMYIDFFVGGEMVGDILFYSHEFQPKKAVRYVVWNHDDLNFFFEVDERPTDMNQAIIQSYIPLLQQLGSMGKSVSAYGVEVRDGEWVRCMDGNGTQLPLEECRRVLGDGPSIILKYPSYPTTQIYATNTTVEIQPRADELSDAITAVQSVITPPRIEFPDVYEPSDNSTEANSSEGVA
ncbi:MAG: hypothetical protein JW834_00685 [Candidatus Diapherotrites archaeon]|nr:hypothetical protein [Candidatus Diapherotrites archaeon]